MPTAQRHYSLDYLRCACILYLMGFWHLFEYTGIARADFNNDFTRRGATIVLALFVLISGFLCGGRGISSAAELGRYYIGRFWRLYPPFVLASLLFWVFKLEQPDRLLRGVALISMFTTDAPRTLWFIDMLVMFYAIAPLFLWVRQRLWACLGVMVAVLAVAGAYGLLTHLLDWRLFLFLPCFVAGILLAQKPPKLTWTLGVVLILLWCLSAWLTTFIPFEDLRDSPLQIPLGLVSAIGLFLVVYGLTDRLKTPGIVSVISYSSYFMYLYHRPLYETAGWLLHGASVPVRTVILIGICVPILIGIAYLLQTAYDRLIKRLMPKTV